MPDPIDLNAARRSLARPTRPLPPLRAVLTADEAAEAAAELAKSFGLAPPTVSLFGVNRAGVTLFEEAAYKRGLEDGRREKQADAFRRGMIHGRALRNSFDTQLMPLERAAVWLARRLVKIATALSDPFDR